MSKQHHIDIMCVNLSIWRQFDVGLTRMMAIWCRFDVNCCKQNLGTTHMVHFRLMEIWMLSFRHCFFLDQRDYFEECWSYEVSEVKWPIRTCKCQTNHYVPVHYFEDFVYAILVYLAKRINSNKNVNIWDVSSWIECILSCLRGILSHWHTNVSECNTNALAMIPV